MWLDAWAEASRRPALGATSRRLNLAWQRLIVTSIVEGIEEGTMSCDDPDAAAWRVVSLLDGLCLQLAAHPGLIERTQVLDWAMTALETEVGLAGRIPRASSEPIVRRYDTFHVQTRSMMSSPSSWTNAIGSVRSTSSQSPESISRCCSTR